jgi:hypothetical protein
MLNAERHHPIQAVQESEPESELGTYAELFY